MAMMVLWSRINWEKNHRELVFSLTFIVSNPHREDVRYVGANETSHRPSDFRAIVVISSPRV